MKVGDSFRIALRNVRIAKTLSIKMIIGLSVAIMILFCMSVYFLTFYKQVYTFSANHANSCYLGSESFEFDTFLEYDDNSKIYKDGARRLGVQDVSNVTQIKMTSTDKGIVDNADIIKNTTMVVEGVEYKGLPEWKCSNEGHAYETNELIVGLYDNRFSVFSQSVIKQFCFENPNEAYLVGELPQNSNELIISNYMLECFGISKDKHDTIIGKRVSIYYDENIAYCKDYIVTGIFDAKVLSVREKDNYFPVWSHIIINYDFETLESMKINGTNSFRLYATNFDELDDIYSEDINNLEVDISPMGEIYIIMNKQISVVNKVLQIIMLHFVVSILIYVVSIFSFFLERNRKYFVMLCAIGLEKRQLYFIHVFEMIAITMLSMIFGIYFSFFLLAGLDELYHDITGFSLVLEPMFLSTIAIIIFALINVFFMFGSIINCKKIANSNIANRL